MRPVQYEQLPVEEKGDDEQLQSPPTISRARKIILVSAISLLTLIFALFVLESVNLLPSKSSLPAAEEDDAEWLRANMPRTTGDQYLLGVGKADITG